VSEHDGKRPLVIFGIGKVGEVLYRHITASKLFAVAAFTCDAPYVPADGRYQHHPVVDFAGVTASYPPDHYDMIVAVGYEDLNGLRLRKYEEAKAKGYRLASFVSPRAAHGDWLRIGDNCIILDNANIEPGTTIGNNVVLWSGVLVGHHATIEDHCWVAGNAVFGGSARLGSRSFVGLAAIVGNDVEIGAGSFIGAGALVTKCADPKSVFVERATDLFRLDSDRFLRISKLR
jgi:sugar O-acyltransferase (sialic acid O-acetyltransferase NeuD family)